MKLKFSFIKILLAITFFSVLNVSIAGELETIFAQKILEGATRSVVTDYSKYLIDRVTGQTAKDFVGLKSSQGIFTTIDLGLSLNDLSHAETDKDKLFASARTSVSALAFTNPPAAAGAGLVLTCTQITDSYLSADHALKLAKIYERVRDNYTHVFNQERTLNENDRNRLTGLTTILKNTNNILTNKKNNFNKQCSVEVLRQSQKLAEFQSCLSQMQELTDLEYVYFVALRDLSYFQFNDPVLQAEYVKGLKGADNIQSVLVKLEDTLKQGRLKLKEQLLKVNEFASKKFMEEVRLQHAKTNVEDAMKDCSRRFDDYIVKSSFASIPSVQRYLQKNMNISLIELDMEKLSESGDLILDSYCFEIEEEEVKKFSSRAMIDFEQFSHGRKMFLESKRDYDQAFDQYYNN